MGRKQVAKALHTEVIDMQQLAIPDLNLPKNAAGKNYLIPGNIRYP